MSIARLTPTFFARPRKEPPLNPTPNHAMQYLARISKIAVFTAVMTIPPSETLTTADEPSSVPGDWIELIGPQGLERWQAKPGDWSVCGDVELSESNPHLLSPKAGQGTIVNGKTGRTVNLLSDGQHGDVEAHIEFLVSKDSNSGVYFQGRYEIQILDSWGVENPESSDCGGIYKRWKDDQGFEGHAPRENASRAPGEWQTFDIVFRAPRFDSEGNKTENARFVSVVHNGTIIHENVELTGPTRSSTFNDELPTGPLMLQGDHGPVAYRNIRLKFPKN